jgi:hypothetical protein
MIFYEDNRIKILLVTKRSYYSTDEKLQNSSQYKLSNIVWSENVDFNC